ncbi:MAG: hypothetical protein NZ481_09530 [Candidatus Kapabacteria bacterium]|nr:hypothetical protein [Candidatus Kapabacteria bacterium]
MAGRILLIVSALLLALTIGRWVRDSFDYGKPLILSKTARETIIVENDPLFQQSIKRIELEPGYWLGLFDATPPFGAVPLSVAWIGLGIIGWWLQRRSSSDVPYLRDRQ